MAEHLQTIIFMVRHGQTDGPFNLDGKVDNQRQLTKLGRKQVEACGRYLEQFEPTTIYSSPLDRCRETTKIILSKLQNSPKVIFSEKLMESYSPSREVREGIGNREDWVLDEIVSKHSGEQVVVSTHQVFIVSIVADFFGLKYLDVPCEFADIYRLVFADKTLVEATRLQPAKALDN